MDDILDDSLVIQPDDIQEIHNPETNPLENYSGKENTIEPVNESLKDQEELDDADEILEEIFDDSIQFYNLHSAVFSVDIHPHEPLILAGGANDQALIWRLDTGELVFELPKHSDSVSSVAFNHGIYSKFIFQMGNTLLQGVWMETYLFLI
jgi:WD40 repeat protein